MKRLSPRRRAALHPLLFAACSCAISVTLPCTTCARWRRHYRFVTDRTAIRRLAEERSKPSSAIRDRLHAEIAS